jgi:hypothetical protein
MAASGLALLFLAAMPGIRFKEISCFENDRFCEGLKFISYFQTLLRATSLFKIILK